MSFDQFLELDGVEQSRMVATYETALRIEDVMNTESKRQMRHKTNKRRS